MALFFWQDYARFTAFSRGTDNAFSFHHVDEAGGARVADA
jgi:hypothetical protein